MTNYSVKITLHNPTLTALKEGGYSLYIFKAVQVTRDDGNVTVWFSNDSYLTQITKSWSDNYQAYISNIQSSSSSSIPIKLGQIAIVNENGNLSSQEDGINGAISIYNKGETQYTCGIKQAIEDSYGPQCALPLYGKQIDVIEPVQKIFLVFDTQTFQPGDVVDVVYNTGVLIDFTGVEERSVGYDINTGWDANNASWAEEIPPNTPLSQFLIEQSQSLVVLADELLAKL